MKVGDVVRIKWPGKDEKNSLGIVVDLESNVLIGQDHVSIMMYHQDGKEEQRWMAENRLDVLL